MRIVVFGGHGFIGQRLTSVLREKGHEAHPLSRRDGVDLLDIRTVRHPLQRLMPDAIFNCAAHCGSIHYVMQHAASVFQDNIRMALNTYETIADICPKAYLVNPLSNCSYPGDAVSHYEPDWWKGEPHHSVFAYANAKRFIYVLSRCYHDQHKLRTTNFLVPNTFGVGDHLDPQRTHAISGLIVRMLHAKRQQEPSFEVWGTGKPVREWGYVDDIAEIMSRALELKDDLIYPINIAQGCGASIRESAEAIRKAIGYEGELRFNSAYEDGAPIKVLDDRRFREIFPDYTFVPHDEAIRRTVAYYRSLIANGP